MEKDTSNNYKRSTASLWIAVVIAFLIIATAWGTFIVISRNHPTTEVPLETR